MLLNINETSEFLGVAKSTLRRWETEERLIPLRTDGGHRRYEKEALIKFKQNGFNIKTENRLTIAYCRVSSNDQKEDLIRQIDNVSNYCIARGYQFKVIQDLGSGLNYNKKGLKELINSICSNEIERIVINYKDRLIRFGFELIEQLCQIYDVQIEIINHTEDKTYEQELVDDVLSIITVFSSSLYGNKSHKNKEILDENKKLFKE